MCSLAFSEAKKKRKGNEKESKEETWKDEKSSEEGKWKDEVESKEEQWKDEKEREKDRWNEVHKGNYELLREAMKKGHGVGKNKRRGSTDKELETVTQNLNLIRRKLATIFNVFIQ